MKLLVKSHGTPVRRGLAARVAAAFGVLTIALGVERACTFSINWSLKRRGHLSSSACRSKAEVSDGQPPIIEFFTMDMCPYAQRTWILLEEKGLPYVRKLVDVRNESQRSWYREHINPLGKVPSIRDLSDGTVLYESEIVNEYLEQKFAAQKADARLLPDDAAGCAKVRLWNHHLNSQLAPAHFTYLMNKNASSEPERLVALETALQYYEDNIVEPYLIGERFTLADVSALPFFERLVFSLERFKKYSIPSSMPKLHNWLQRTMTRPSFLATKRPDGKLEEVYQMFLSMDYKFGGLNRN